MPAVLKTPALDTVIERMDHRLAELASLGDRRERFLLMYRTFKVELRRNLGDGRFRDPEWSEAICCRMAEMYFEAEAAYDREGADCPAPWSHAFDAARGRRTNLIQDMLLGMNAHINYDLPFCTIDTMRRFGDVDELRRGALSSLRFRQLLRRRYHDFLLINEIAWESIPFIQDVICERFNRLLKYANILSFRVTRLMAERVICEYRDRAWAHTLVLLTAGDGHEGDATRRHISLFALRAAGLIERLSLNPLRHLRRGSGLPSDSASVRPVARTLVEHLGYRPTRAIARQALIEYGPEVQPVLVRTLTHAPPLPRVRAELYRVLGAHPTTAAVGALAAALPRETEARDALLRVLAGLDPAARPEGLVEPLMAVARDEHRAARRLVALTAGLGPEERHASLLGRALRERAHRSLCRARHALHATGHPPALELPDCADLLARLPALHELLRAARRVAASVGDSPLDPDPPPRRDMIEQLLRHRDPWIRACAAWWAGPTGSGAEAVVARLRQEDHELVKETALGALRKGLPSDRLREVAEELLRRRTYNPDTPARTLARQILEGEVEMITTIEKVLHLKNVELFQDILAEDLVTIARVAEEHRFAAGDRLIRSQEPGVATYVMVEGTVEVRGLEGQELATVGPGGVLGEMSVVSDMPTSADCIAATDGLALRIAREDFHALLQDHPTTAIGVMHVLAQRLRRTNRRAADGAREPESSSQPAMTGVTRSEADTAPASR